MFRIGTLMLGIRLLVFGIGSLVFKVFKMDHSSREGSGEGSSDEGGAGRGMHSAADESR